MDNNEQRTQETNDAVETDTSTEEYNGTQTASETETATASPAENSQGSQTESQPDPAQTQPVDAYLNAIAKVNQDLVILQKQFDTHIARNQSQQKMFDKFYQEMEANKGDALFEAFHKPVAHNLIDLYDHFVGVEAQLTTICETFGTAETRNADVDDPFESLDNWFKWYDDLKDRQQKKLMSSANDLLPILKSLKALPRDKQPLYEKELLQFQKNLTIVCGNLKEVLYRMNVIPYDDDERPEKLDLKLHKTVDTKSTENREEDMHVAETRKIGFYWSKKDEQGQVQKQVIRPKEVVIYRYDPSSDEPKEATDDGPTNEPEDPTGKNDTSESEDPVDEKQTDKKGDETDG